ncbi:MAG: hypothetical protein RIS09_173 [Actinomycetota bacterium]
MFELSLLNFVVLSLAGILTGFINGVIGGGSLISYLALTATGVPPVLAASTNTVGVVTGNPSALITPLRERQIQFRAWFPLAAMTAVGSVVGGYMLISLPERVFEFLIPFLLIISGASVWIRPKRSEVQSRGLLPLLFGSGVYNGYFGPGQGILNLSILYRGTTYEPATLVILKNYIITASNVVVSILFAVSNKVIWLVIPILWIAVGLGGWLSHMVTRHLNEKILRIGLSSLAFSSSAYFLFS